MISAIKMLEELSRLRPLTYEEVDRLDRAIRQDRYRQKKASGK